MVRYRHGSTVPLWYDKKITTAKMRGTAATVTGSAVIAFAAIYMVRANLPESIVLWPEYLDEPVAIAVTVGLSAAWRGVCDYWKHGKEK